MKFQSILLAVALGATSFAASASGFDAGLGVKTYSGNVNAGAGSVSAGGSMSETAAAGNGYAFSANANAGGGSSYAGGNVARDGVTTWSGVDSFSAGGSLSFGGGNYSSEAAGGNGTDVNSYSSGSWTQSGFGGSLGFGGFSQR